MVSMLITGQAQPLVHERLFANQPHPLRVGNPKARRDYLLEDAIPESISLLARLL